MKRRGEKAHPRSIAATAPQEESGPMARCVIFGGCGSRGQVLARHFAEQERFQEIVLADIRHAPSTLPASVRFVPCDVRHEFTPALASLPADWIFNFASVRRAHAHAVREHFGTQIDGTRQITTYAERVGCERIFLASSTAGYGRTATATDEAAPTYPETPEGAARLIAETMLATWQARAPHRQLVVARAGALYGPGCGGELRQMIRAIRRGGVYAGGKSVRKSYGYIAGFIESISFAMARHEPVLTYNYVEPHSATVAEFARLVRHFVSSKKPVVALPSWLAKGGATVAHSLLRNRSPFDPATVSEAMAESWIIPRRLQELNFPFHFGFLRSLEHWRTVAPEDFP